ncbi:MAG: HU family DNA-binding protein [Oscillospiraceae bacterium]|nr:HU family DNA-binding protein [Oscillospiraceae bacterium]
MTPRKKSRRKRENPFRTSAERNFPLFGIKPKKEQIKNADNPQTVKKRRYIKMTKSDLIAAVATKIGSSKKDSEKAVAAVLESITEALANGEAVQLVGFGTFEVKERAARKGINPRTKETIDIDASKLPSFKAGKALKEAVK